MKLIGNLLRSVKACGFFEKPLLCRRAFSSSPNFAGTDDNERSYSSESVDDFERRIFGDIGGDTPNSSSFYQKLDKIGKDRSAYGFKYNPGGSSGLLDGLGDSFNTLSDGMDGKLKEAATYFEFDPEEIDREDYTYRPDMTFRPGMTYDTKDLDLTKPGVRKPWRRPEFETTTEEVLKSADFRNVSFLANFLTEAGIIIKRSQTKISAKAQRKVAREIKTARAFGLLPFTTMGTKQFVYGRTMEELDSDYEYETHETPNFVDESPDPLDS